MERKIRILDFWKVLGSMIQSAGKGYAVNTAREETKKAADEVIPGYAENGVLEVLKTFL